MAYPQKEEALALLEWANSLNPGSWRVHSLGVARAAMRIAEAAGLDGAKAYILGMMHDIGRYEGPRGMHHAIVGYDLMMERGWDEAARICVTHSFPDHAVMGYIGPKDVTAEELARITQILNDRPYDDYDRLIQLCDAISWGEGVCVMEKRLVNVVMRYGTTGGIIDKWKSQFEIKEYFDKRIGKSLYTLFPECAKNTLEA